MYYCAVKNWWTIHFCLCQQLPWARINHRSTTTRGSRNDSFARRGRVLISKEELQSCTLADTAGNKRKKWQVQFAEYIVAPGFFCETSLHWSQLGLNSEPCTSFLKIYPEFWQINVKREIHERKSHPILLIKGRKNSRIFQRYVVKSDGFSARVFPHLNFALNSQILVKITPTFREISWAEFWSKCPEFYLVCTKKPETRTNQHTLYNDCQF